MVTDIPIDQLKIWTDGNMKPNAMNMTSMSMTWLDLGAYQRSSPKNI